MALISKKKEIWRSKKSFKKIIKLLEYHNIIKSKKTNRIKEISWKKHLIN